VPEVPGTGIVYCLTVEQTEQVATFLQSRGIDAVAYSGRTPPDERLPLEARFKANELKCLVATSALGMGVDKPDVAFVFHLGAPPSPIAYYQQVGRAGRSVDHAEAWLLPGAEDRAIWDWFAAVGLPPERLVTRVLDELGDEPMSVPALERAVDLKRTRLETLLKILDVDGAVERLAEGWVRTGAPWHYDVDRVARVAQARADEAQEMVRYAEATSCLMHALRASLDDPEAVDCGRCTVCLGTGDPVVLDPQVVRAAVEFLRGADVVVEARKQWARGADGQGVPKGNIAPSSRAEDGRALCRVGDSGWWPALEACEAAGAPDDELVDGVFAALKRWPWEARPTWVTWVPADGSGPGLAEQVARRVAAAGKLEVHDTIRRTGAPGGRASNSAYRLAEAWRSVELTGPVPAVRGPALVVSDRIESRWTTAVVAHLLRGGGADAVLPFALALA
jgi:ATP-dependent DNA helicase RecQ